jgi:hypothetical protein
MVIVSDHPTPDQRIETRRATATAVEHKRRRPSQKLIQTSTGAIGSYSPTLCPSSRVATAQLSSHLFLSPNGNVVKGRGVEGSRSPRRPRSCRGTQRSSSAAESHQHTSSPRSTAVFCSRGMAPAVATPVASALSPAENSAIDCRSGGSSATSRSWAATTEQPRRSAASAVVVAAVRWRLPAQRSSKQCARAY